MPDRGGGIGAALRRARKGAALVEYALVAGLIGIVAIGAVSRTGDGISTAFSQISERLRIEYLIATSQRHVRFPDGEVAIGQDCYTGTPGADTVASGSGGAGDAKDCYDGKGGSDTFALAQGPDRDILIYLAEDDDQVELPAGRHAVIVGAPTRGTDTLIPEAGSAGGVVDLRPLETGNVTVTTSNTVLKITLSGSADIDIEDQFPGTAFERFVFADGLRSSEEMRTIGIASQTTPNSDSNIQGTALADTIAPLAGNDVIVPHGGDDTIVYEAGDDTIVGGYAGTGSDTLDLSSYTRAQVAFSVEAGGVEIATPDGDIFLTAQAQFNLDYGNASIDIAVFSDREMTGQEILDAAS